MKRYKRTFIISFILILGLNLIFPTILNWLGLPKYYHIVEGNKELLQTKLPFEVSVKSNKAGILKINGHQLSNKELNIDLNNSLAIQASTVGEYNLDFRLFGIFPLQKMVVNVIPEVKVIPGGQSIGVILKSNGIMVVRNSYVIDTQGNKEFPAEEAGIREGESLLALNGIKIKNKYHLAKMINQFGKQGERLNFKVRNKAGQIIFKEVIPVKSKEGYYMIGVYVDDGATGVGTMSFYNPEGGYYAALGHMITEVNTKLKINVGDGEIVKADISGINQGKDGLPGEKLGTFFNDRGVLGNIVDNNKFGIYGNLFKVPKHPYFNKPIPVATITEIDEDLAQIYTVIQGGEIEKFEVKIEKVRSQYHPSEKGLIIRIVDSKLLETTGGIIQGMSGSPIVQNGKLVGVVTHVFVNDSTRGYGILAQWMLRQVGTIKREEDTKELVS